jgi:hypothetical protein
VLHGTGRTARAMCQSVNIEGGIVGQGIGLQVGPEVFDGVEFGSVRRQVFQVRRARQDAFVHELSLVGLEAVPDEHDGRVQLTLKMLEEVHSTLGGDVAVGMQSKIQGEPVAAGCNAKSCDRRYLLMAALALSQDRSVPPQAPRTAHQGRHEHTGFVQKDDRRSQARGVFFTLGQSCAIQALMRSSSRSTARRVGFCGEKPKPCSSRLT